MTALAIQADVESDLGRTLTSTEAAEVDAALEKASDYVRAETGRKFEAGTYTVTRRVRNGRVRLDSPDSVSAVVTIDTLGAETALTGWTLRGDVLYGLGYACDVEVTYTSTAAVPDEIRRLTAALAARSVTSAAQAGVESQQIGSLSMRFGSGDSIFLTKSERSTLARYRRLGGSVSLL
jgi:hypothetical protein